MHAGFWGTTLEPEGGARHQSDVSYVVKEIYYSLQGEGARAGRASVLCRFAGCNLWTGREEDRPRAACSFCDTDFVGTDGPGGGRFADPARLAEAIAAVWCTGAGGGSQTAGEAQGAAVPYVVFTGGEPLLQLDEPLLARCRGLGFETAVETNGTLPVPQGVDWLTVSPKAGASLVVTSGSELKLVYPQEILPESVERLDFALLYLQPMDGPRLAENTARAIAYCRAHPRWRLGVQMHKLLGLR